MARKTLIRITEADMHHMIKEAVREALKQQFGSDATSINKNKTASGFPYFGGTAVYKKSGKPKWKGEPAWRKGMVNVDIGGGTTDIAVVEDGGVEGTKMFSIGGRSFTHQIAERLGLDFEAAEKLKLLADSPNMKPELRRKFDKAVERNIEVWQSGVELAIEDFESENLPGQIMLCGGGASLSAISETLATGDWYKGLPFARRPIVSLIDPEDVPDMTNDTDRELDHTFITAMGLLRVGIDTLLGTGDDKSIKAKLARLLKN